MDRLWRCQGLQPRGIIGLVVSNAACGRTRRFHVWPRHEHDHRCRCESGTGCQYRTCAASRPGAHAGRQHPGRPYPSVRFRRVQCQCNRRCEPDFRRFGRRTVLAQEPWRQRFRSLDFGCLRSDEQVPGHRPSSCRHSDRYVRRYVVGCSDLRAVQFRRRRFLTGIETNCRSGETRRERCVERRG